MDELDARFAELKARHVRFAKWHALFASNGCAEAAWAVFLTADRNFAEGQMIHAERMERQK